MSAAPSESPPGEVSPPRLLPHWLWGLSGLGLFLAGAIVGAVLMVSLTLYRQPPATVPAPVASAVSPTATLPIVRTPVPPTPPPTTRPQEGPGIGQRAPDLELPGLDGITYTLGAYRGQTVILNFWASWCPPCRQEWPGLLAFAREISGSGVTILAVNVEEPVEIVRRFVATDTLPFPVLLDTSGEASERYRVLFLPTTFLIAPDGLVRQVVPGNMDRAALGRLVGHP